MQSNSKKRSIK